MARLKIHWPDVIVRDVEMPRMDGVSFLKKIMRPLHRRHAGTRSHPHRVSPGAAGRDYRAAHARKIAAFDAR